MTRWADYLISEVTYDPKHRIKYATRHKDTEEGIMEPEVADRSAIVDDLKDGISYCTIISGLDKWTLGEKIRFHYVRGHRVIRIDSNKATSDHLGQIPEVSNPPAEPAEERPKEIEENPAAQKKQSEKQVHSKKTEEKPAPKEEPVPPKEMQSKDYETPAKKDAAADTIEAKIQELASVKKELDELNAESPGAKLKKKDAGAKSDAKSADAQRKNSD